MNAIACEKDNKETCKETHKVPRNICKLTSPSMQDTKVLEKSLESSILK